MTSLIAAAGLAASTNAFLLPVPPETSKNDIIATLPVPVKVVDVPITAESQTLNLNCPDCPIRVFGHRGKNGKAKIKTDILSHLELEFTIDHAAESDRLMLNGFELYPHTNPMSQVLAGHILAAELVPEFKHKRPGHHRHVQTGAHPLGFGLRVSPVAKDQEDNFELLVVDLQIIEVGNIIVDGIPNVQVKLIKTPKGGLMMADIATTASETIQKNPMDKQEECTTLICKWRAMLLQQFGRFRNKPCGGRPGKTVEQAEDAQESPAPEHPKMRHGHRAKWGHLLKNIASHILLPIAVGIMAGVAASLLGMMVGTAIVCLWRTFFRPASTRRHSRHSHTHRAAKKEAVASDEKASLMAHQEEDVDSPTAHVEEGIAGNKKLENDA